MYLDDCVCVLSDLTRLGVERKSLYIIIIINSNEKLILICVQENRLVDAECSKPIFSIF